MLAEIIPPAHAFVSLADTVHQPASNGNSVGAERDLSDYMLQHRPGDTVTLRVLRSGSTREVQVTLGVLPAQQN